MCQSNHDHEDSHSHDFFPPLHPAVVAELDRRAALRLFGLTAAATLAGCGTGVNSPTTTSTGTTATTTALTASATSVAAGTAVKLTATVTSSAATGTVSFYNGTTLLGTATLTGGVATLTTTFASAGAETLTAVYSGSTTYAASTSAVWSLTVTGSTSACSATLEGEEGPYFVDDSAAGYFRSSILTNLDGTSTQTGIPFTLNLYVFDSKSACAAMQNVQVDIWHCNAAGIYSAEAVESTTGQSWLRGYQITDATGKVQFNTIIPGWYSGRTTHIHLRLRSTYDATTTSGSNTMQLFFDQTLINTLATSVSPYSSEGTNPTTNASDRVYAQQELGTTLMTLTGSVSTGYTATVNAYLPI